MWTGWVSHGTLRLYIIDHATVREEGSHRRMFRHGMYLTTLPNTAVAGPLPRLVTPKRLPPTPRTSTRPEGDGIVDRNMGNFHIMIFDAGNRPRMLPRSIPSTASRRQNIKIRTSRSRASFSPHRD